ncbi:MAG: hypothetical protein ACRC28_12070 [Clostridium sp.]|uniref:hypothetical protein n=1 Tax=Clostridium sp. TaxID=1506 RepID=UPI003F365E50
MLKVRKGNEPEFLLEFKRKNKPKTWDDYNNLIVSCNEKNSCGSYKGNKYNDKFLNPIVDDLDEYIDYNIASGEIIPKEKDERSIKYLRAKYTIDILNLNSYELRSARANLIDILSVYEGENKKYIQFFLDDRHNFPSLIKIYMSI